MKKAMKKIIVAGVALVAALGLATGTTFAWFSMNNSVTVTGMTVKTQVSSNLFIAEDTLDSTAKKAEANFTTSVSTSISAILEPASTTTGTTFFYTTDAKADGDAKADTYTQYGSEAALTGTDATTYDSAFSKAYGVTQSGANTLISGQTGAVPFKDYVFQLKAVATGDSYLNLTNLELKYTKKASESDNNKAYRVAVFLEDITSSNPSGSVGTKQAIFAKSDAHNFSYASESAEKAVTSTSALGAVSYNTYADTTNNTLAKITAGSTKYYKVVVRLWLEGEDTTCNNDTFLALTGSWALSLELKLEDSNSNAITYLTIN